MFSETHAVDSYQVRVCSGSSGSQCRPAVEVDRNSNYSLSVGPTDRYLRVAGVNCGNQIGVEGNMEIVTEGNVKCFNETFIMSISCVIEGMNHKSKCL